MHIKLLQRRKHMNDAQIIRLYWDRNETAITETKNKYGSYCFSIAYNILSDREDSEECLNDTWLKTWNNIPPKRPSHLRLFLARIIRNTAFDKFRSNTAIKRKNSEVSIILEELNDCIPASDNIEDYITAKDLQDTMNRFLRSLPRRDCDIFLRRYFYGDSVKHIALEYNMTESNISTLLFRIRKKLKAHLEGDDYII